MIADNHPDVDEVYFVPAGKFRRYHGEGFISHILDVKTVAKNIRDFFLVLAGLSQSYKLLGKLKPDVVFIKGGFVGVPVGLAAAVRKIPYITHDSDAVPGLANRLIGRWAKLHAVALPKNNYNYPPDKTVTVGVPVSSDFTPVDDALTVQYKHEAGIDPSSRVVFVTGGGMGAERLNNAMLSIAPDLIRENPRLIIVHSTGHKHEGDVMASYDQVLTNTKDRARVIVKGFIDGLYKYSGMADVIVCRAGATNIAEFASQHKACIIVPNPKLAGGHQVKNAEYLVSKDAAMVVDDNSLETAPETLKMAIKELLSTPDLARRLGKNLSQFASQNASKELARLIISSPEGK